MIKGTLDYLGIIIAGVLMLRLFYDFFPKKATLFIPLVLVIYIVYMTMASFLVFEQNLVIEDAYRRMMSTLLPMMIFLMLLHFRLDLFKRLGSRMILAFFATTLSLILGFSLIYFLFHTLVFDELNRYFATLAGSWSGGTANMLAVASAIGLPKEALGSVIAVDSLLYGIWLMLLLALVPFAPLFNRFTQAPSFEQPQDITDEKRLVKRTPWAVPTLLVAAVAVKFLIDAIVVELPKNELLTPTFLTIVSATVLGVIGSFTKLGKLAYSNVMGTYMLYFIVALIASQAHIIGLATLGSFLMTAALVLLFHALFMLGVAKLFKLDLFSIGIASLAHIGGIASAPILASAYNKALVPVGVAMATVGYLLGTVVGLFIAWILGAF